MGPLVYFNIIMEGMLAFAALHYFLLWWRSRSERVLLVFSIFAAAVSVPDRGDRQSDNRRLDRDPRRERSTSGPPSGCSRTRCWSPGSWPRSRRCVPDFLMKALTIALIAVSVTNFSALGFRINGTVTGLSQFRSAVGRDPDVVEREWRRVLGRAYLSTTALNAGLCAVYRVANLASRPARQCLDRADRRCDAFGRDRAVHGGRPALPRSIRGILQFVVWIPVLSLLLSREHARRDERLATTQGRYRTFMVWRPRPLWCWISGSDASSSTTRKRPTCSGGPQRNW